MDLVVNEEFTKMYSDEELMGARRIQASLSTYYCGTPAVFYACGRANARSAQYSRCCYRHLPRPVSAQKHTDVSLLVSADPLHRRRREAINRPFVSAALLSGERERRGSLLGEKQLSYLVMGYDMGRTVRVNPAVACLSIDLAVR